MLENYFDWIWLLLQAPGGFIWLFVGIGVIQALLRWRFPAPGTSVSDPDDDDPDNRLLYEQVLRGSNRRQALSQLIAHRTPDAIRLLCRIVGEATPELAHEAAGGLVRIGKPAVPQIARVVQHTDSASRARLISILGEIGDPAAVTTLCRVLADESSALRGQAAHALHRIARRRRSRELAQAAPVLRQLLGHEQVAADPNLPLYRKLLRLVEYGTEASRLPIPGTHPSPTAEDLPRPARKAAHRDLPLPQHGPHE